MEGEADEEERENRTCPYCRKCYSSSSSLGKHLSVTKCAANRDSQVKKTRNPREEVNYVNIKEDKEMSLLLR